MHLSCATLQRPLPFFVGRVHRESPKATSAASHAAAQLRINRRNNAKQAQLKKRQSLVSATRIFNGIDGTPRTIAIVPLTEDVSVRNVSSRLAQAIDGTLEEDPVNGLQKLRYAPILPLLRPIPGPYSRMNMYIPAGQTGSRPPSSLSLCPTARCTPH